jgi:conjugal transfer ATP-binding protein TraC
MNTDVNAFLSAVREQMNYRQEQVLTSSGDYNEDEKLNRQVVDPGLTLRFIHRISGWSCRRP